MQLKSIDVTNSQSATLSLPLEDISSGFIVKKIEGLDPVKTTLVSSSFANLDGEQYHSSRRVTRNIKLTLGLEPDYGMAAVKDLRDQLYSFFMSKRQVTLGFHLFDKFAVSVFLDHLDVVILGRVEDFNSDLFTEEPEVVISIMCFNPDFYDPEIITFDGMTVADMTQETLTYAGSIETGVEFTLTLDRNLDAFTIYHQPPDGTLRMVDVSYPLLTGDVLRISSVVGSKGVRLTRAGVESSILYAQTPQSTWVELQPGDNLFRVYAVGAPIPFSFEYTNKYGGL